jgi:hypothetical protein
MTVRRTHGSRLIFTNIKANRSLVRNEQVRLQLLVPYSTKKSADSSLRFASVCKINFDIKNKLEARPEDFTRLNPSNFGLYTRFTFLKLCSGKEVGVFIPFRFPNRFNSYILPSPHPPIRMHLKFIIIKILSLPL